MRLPNGAIFGTSMKSALPSVRTARADVVSARGSHRSSSCNRVHNPKGLDKVSVLS